ncbi:MAG: hypothetical protein ABEH38_00250 [Flavobacteriales bacterium]
MLCKWIIRISLVFLVSGLLFQACYPPDDFPPKPEIEFKKFEKADNNKAYLTISFTDGDGNIGLKEGDTTGKFSPGNRYHHNLFLEYYEKQNGDWVHRDLDPPFYYRIPPLEPKGKSKALKGDIRVELEPTYFDPGSSYDTIKYSIQLADRDLNESNIVETDPIVTP